jgi:hypothetical protein
MPDKTGLGQQKARFGEQSSKKKCPTAKILRRG